MTDRQTIIDLFEKHADWHNGLAWIEVGCAADLVVDALEATAPSQRSNGYKSAVGHAEDPA